MMGLPLDDWPIYCEPAHAGVYTKPDSPDMPQVDEHSRSMLRDMHGQLSEISETRGRA